MSEKYISLDNLKEYNDKMKETYIEPLETDLGDMESEVNNLKNRLVKDTISVTDTYNKRTTANGEVFLDGSNAVINTAVGNSVVVKDTVNEDGSINYACKNICNFAEMNFQQSNINQPVSVIKHENGAITFINLCEGINDIPYVYSTDVDKLRLKPNTTYATYVKFTQQKSQDGGSDGGTMQGQLWLQTNSTYDSSGNRLCIAGNGFQKIDNKEYILFNHFTTPADISIYTHIVLRMAAYSTMTYKEIMIIEDNENIYNETNFPEYYPYFTAPRILHTKISGIESKNVDGSEISTLAFPSMDIKWGMTVDFENKKIINQGNDIILTGEEPFHLYYYSNNNGVSMERPVKPGNKAVADFICTHTERVGSGYQAGNLWCGYNNSKSFMWIGILDILGYTTKGVQATGEEETVAIEQFKQYLRDEAAKGTPVTIRYLTAEVTETPFSGALNVMGNTYKAWSGGTEKILGNTSAELGVLNNLTQTYALNDSIINRIDTVESIAKGANQAISFDNYSEMISAFNAFTNDKYYTGQNVMIVTLNVPDLWVSGIAAMSIGYNYTSDEEFVNLLKTNGSVQVGYYILSALETQKVDLTEYAKNEDLDGKLDKYTTAAGSTKVYAVNSNGGQQMINVSYGHPVAKWAAAWDDNGRLKSNTPAADLDAANKLYVDDTIPVLAKKMLAEASEPWTVDEQNAACYAIGALCLNTSNVFNDDVEIGSTAMFDASRATYFSIPSTIYAYNAETGITNEIILDSPLASLNGNNVFTGDVDIAEGATLTLQDAAVLMPNVLTASSSDGSDDNDFYFPDEGGVLVVDTNHDYIKTQLTGPPAAWSTDDQFYACETIGAMPITGGDFTGDISANTISTPSLDAESIYQDGTNISEIYATKAEIPTDYIPSTGGDFTGRVYAPVLASPEIYGETIETDEIDAGNILQSGTNIADIYMTKDGGIFTGTVYFVDQGSCIENDGQGGLTLSGERGLTLDGGDSQYVNIVNALKIDGENIADIYIPQSGGTFTGTVYFGQDGNNARCHIEENSSSQGNLKLYGYNGITLETVGSSMITMNGQIYTEKDIIMNGGTFYFSQGTSIQGDQNDILTINSERDVVIQASGGRGSIDLDGNVSISGTAIDDLFATKDELNEFDGKYATKADLEGITNGDIDLAGLTNISFAGSQYTNTATQKCAISLNNGDIMGLNGLYFADSCNAAHEGILFPSTGNNGSTPVQAQTKEFNRFYGDETGLYYQMNRIMGDGGTTTTAVAGTTYTMATQEWVQKYMTAGTSDSLKQIDFPQNQYVGSSLTQKYTMGLNNGDIIGLNGIYFSDSTGVTEGLHFPANSSTNGKTVAGIQAGTWNTLYVDGDNLCLNTGRTLEGEIDNWGAGTKHTMATQDWVQKQYYVRSDSELYVLPKRASFKGNDGYRDNYSFLEADKYAFIYIHTSVPYGTTRQHKMMVQMLPPDENYLNHNIEINEPNTEIAIETGFSVASTLTAYRWGTELQIVPPEVDIKIESITYFEV